MSRNAGEAAKGAMNVGHNVIEMNQAAKESLKGTAQVERSSEDLEKIAGEMRQTVSRFRV